MIDSMVVPLERRTFLKGAWATMAAGSLSAAGFGVSEAYAQAGAPC